LRKLPVPFAYIAVNRASMFSFAGASPVNAVPRWVRSPLNYSAEQAYRLNVANGPGDPANTADGKPTASIASCTGTDAAHALTSAVNAACNAYAGGGATAAIVLN